MEIVEKTTVEMLYTVDKFARVKQLNNGDLRIVINGIRAEAENLLVESIIREEKIKNRQAC